MLRAKSSNVVAAAEEPRLVGPGGRALLASRVRRFTLVELFSSSTQRDAGELLPPVLPDALPPTVFEHRSPGLRVAVQVHFNLRLAGHCRRMESRGYPDYTWMVVQAAPADGCDPRLGLLVEGEVRVEQEKPKKVVPYYLRHGERGQLFGPTFVKGRTGGRLLEVNIRRSYSVHASATVRLRLWAAPFRLRLAAANAVGHAHDVVLVADGAREFPAHRGVLAAASPALAALLRTDCRETRLGRIDMHCSAAALELFLQCAYAGSAPLADDDWGQQGVEVEVLRLADMLLMDALKVECESRLLRLPADRAVWLLHQAVHAPQVPEAALRRAAAQVAAGWSRVRRSPEWAALVAEQPAALELVRKQAVHGHRQRHRAPASPSS